MKRSECEHEWDMCGVPGQNSIFTTSVLKRGCAKCGQVRQWNGLSSDVLPGLIAAKSNREGFVIVQEVAP